MALIKQVKVGGVTYDISMRAGDGIEISDSGVVGAKLGSGLCIGVSGEICASDFIAGFNSGLVKTPEGILQLNIGSGLTIANGELEVKIGTGLTLNSNGELDIIS